MRIFLASLFFSTFVSKRMTNRTITIVLEIKNNFPEQPRLGFKPQTNFSGFEWLRKHELVVEISRTLKQNSNVHHQRDFYYFDSENEVSVLIRIRPNENTPTFLTSWVTNLTKTRSREKKKKKQMLIWSLQNDKRFAKHVLLGWVIGIKSLKYLVLCHNLILFGTARNRPRPHRRAHFFELS